MPARRRLAGCALLSAFVLAAGLFPRPPLLDAVTGQTPAGARLAFPFLHDVLGPLTLFADAVGCQSARASIALLFLLLTAGFVFFRWFFLAEPAEDWKRPAATLRAFGMHVVGVALLVAFAALAPRSGPRLVVDDADDLIVDFHSHTAASWDGRRSFSAARNAAWHEAAGFHAGFITDHNVFWAASAAHGMSRLARERAPRGAYAALEGEELSLHGAHVVVLGNRALVSQDEYSDGLDGLKRLLKEAAPKHGALTLMSLPEYERHYADRLEDVAAWGADGFELVAASPRGLDVSAAFRERVARLCRERNLLALGSTDNHGYGGGACVWNVVRLPGWRTMNVDELQEALLAKLHADRFSAVRVLERPRPQAPRDWRIWLHGVTALFDALRRTSRLHWFFTLLLIWSPWLFWGFEGKIRARP